MKIITCPNYFTMNLDERREFFIDQDPNFLELEKILFTQNFAVKGQRLIYIPEMAEAKFYIEGSSFQTLTTKSRLNYKGQCHDMSYLLYTKDTIKDKQLVHGFYMTDDLKWRNHSWLRINGVNIDVTGNVSVCAYGKEIDPVVFYKMMIG